MWPYVLTLFAGFTIGWFCSRMARSVETVDQSAALLRDLAAATRRCRQAEAAANYYRARTVSAEGQRTHVQHVDRWDADHPSLRRSAR